jgi:hypothetical protein
MKDKLVSLLTLVKECLVVVGAEVRSVSVWIVGLVITGCTVGWTGSRRVIGRDSPTTPTLPTGLSSSPLPSLRTPPSS